MRCDVPTTAGRPLRTRLILIAAGLALPSLGAAGVLVSALGAPAGSHPPPALYAAAAACALAGGAGAATLLRLARRTDLAFAELERSLASFAAGEGPPAFEIEGGDEFAHLADRLRGALAGAHASRAAARLHQDSLESELKARTVELQQKNLALAYQNEKVLEANRLKSAFLANVSHELRTPLNAILALSDMLRDEITGPLNEEQRRQMEMIYHSGDNLLHLINEVLDLSKIESGRMEDKRSEVAIVDHLIDAAESLRALAEEKGLALVLEPEGGGQAVSIDADKVRQVFINILGNAIKFTEHGSVTARMRVLQDEDLFYAEVQDTGPGIPPPLHNSIFEEFRRLEHPEGERLEGSGLGLAISKKLVNLMGGDLWVDSAVGAGSRFSFVVPLRSAAPVPVADEESTAHRRWSTRVRALAEPGRKRVLVVDDDVVESGVLARYLRKRDLDILTAHDCQEALGVLRREEVDLVLMDLLSGGDDGFRLIEHVTRDPQLKALPILVNTARRLTESEQGFLSRHVGGIFEKGTRGVDDLMELVSRTVRSDSPDPEANLPPGAGGEFEAA